MPVNQNDPWGEIRIGKETEPPPPAVVKKFHDRGDTDSGPFALHHTLGSKHNQAAPGDHSHFADAWLDWTPTWSSLGTAPVIGNGSLVGAYKEITTTVFYRIGLTFGSTTTPGTGVWIFSLPKTPHADYLISYTLNTTGIASRPGISLHTLIGRYYPPNTGVVLLTTDASSGQAATGVPLAWTTADTVFFEGMYERA